MKKIEKNMIVGHVLDEHPETLNVFLKHGFTPLKDPVLRKTMPYKVTIEQACKMHSVDLEKFLEEINRLVEGEQKKG
jgi:hypothetical protein